METKSTPSDKQQSPVKADLETILRKEIEIDEKLDRILKILEPVPKPSVAFSSASDATAGKTSSPERFKSPRIKQ